MTAIQRSIRLLSELIFPSNIYCISCGALIDLTRPYSLCDKCAREILWNTGRTCTKCGKALSENNYADHCHDCKRAEHHFDSGLSCATYAGPVREIIRGMKYKDMPYAAYKIADAMYDRYIETADVDTQTGELSLPDLIVSVPMNEVKKRARGYDQAEVIASALASRLGVKYSEGLLVRNAETSVMSALSRAERGANIACAIELRCELAQDCCKDMQIVLIDDVYTTGSTADACAAVLKQAGAASVKVFTFATGTDMHITSRRNG